MCVYLHTYMHEYLHTCIYKYMKLLMYTRSRQQYWLVTMLHQPIVNQDIDHPLQLILPPRPHFKDV